MAAVDALENYDPSTLVVPLFQLYITLSPDNKLVPKIQELLVRGNLLPLLSQISVESYSILQELLLQQGNKYLQQLEFIRNTTRNLALQNIIDTVINQVQSFLPTANGLNIML